MHKNRGNVTHFFRSMHSGSPTYLVLSGAIYDLLLCLAHNVENQRLPLLCPVGSHTQVDLVRAGVLLEGLCRDKE